MLEREGDFLRPSPASASIQAIGSPRKVGDEMGVLGEKRRWDISKLKKSMNHQETKSRVDKPGAEWLWVKRESWDKVMCGKAKEQGSKLKGGSLWAASACWNS